MWIPYGLSIRCMYNMDDVCVCVCVCVCVINIKDKTVHCESQKIQTNKIKLIDVAILSTTLT